MEQQERDPVIDQNGSNSGTKISDEEDRILTDAYYNPNILKNGQVKFLPWWKERGIKIYLCINLKTTTMR